MSKIDLKRLDSVTANDTTATALINDNFKTLQDAIENSLSRDGSTPNFMDADLDMNSYKIINSGEAVDDNDVVNLKYVKESIGGAVQAAQDASDSAAKAASSAQSALVSASNAAAAVRNAETTITQATALLEETQEYVDTAKVDIDAIVAQGKVDIDQYVTDVEEEVKQIARDEANKAIENAAAEATQIATDNINTYYNDTIKPELDSSVASASVSATAAAESASNADADADNAAESAGLAAQYASQAYNTSQTFNTTFVEKTNEFNTNAQSKIDIFNENASLKQIEIDNSVSEASISAEEARKYAQGTIDELPSGSSKYWAEKTVDVFNNADAESQTVYQERIVLDNPIIVLQEKVCRYFREIESGDSFSIDTSNIKQSNKDITFELILKVSSVVPFDFSTFISDGSQWLGGEVPDFSETGEHWIAFVSSDGGITWRGSYEGRFPL